MENLESLYSLSMSNALPAIEILPAIMNFILCVCMSFLVRSFYVKYSISLTGKHHVGVVIPILACIVFLIIMVVKSSLALSLGLVGALSIVRFRTPIKEPEELVYLFLAIAIGLGYAAGHTLLTTILSLSILIIVYFWLSNKNIEKTGEYNLVINWDSSIVSFSNISDALIDILKNIKLIRLEQGEYGNTAVLVVIPETNINIDLLVSRLRALDSKAKISFYEAKTNW